MSNDFQLDARLPTKRACLEHLMDQGKVLVHINARLPGVILPAHLEGQAVVPLNLSHLFNLDVFELDDETVRANLSFQGERFLCVLPWPSIFAISSHETGESHVFPSDIPPELVSTMATILGDETTSEVEVPEPAPPKRGPPKLTLVK